MRAHFVCRAAHYKGLSFRGINMDKVLITGHSRFRISNAGIMDVLEAESQATLVDMQVFTVFACIL